MEELQIVGGTRLSGKVAVQGAKNAALPIIAASLLNEGECVLSLVPPLKDVASLLQVFTHLGAVVAWQDGCLVIKTKDVAGLEVPDHLMRQMRASNLVMGPLLARFGQVTISYPGGCNIGARPMDLHLAGFEALGAEIEEQHGKVRAKTRGLQGAKISLDFPSVGATENLMMAACLAQGETVISNAAHEPEVADLAGFLNAMGARIKGAGTDKIVIDGVATLHACRYQVMADRIEAGTHMIAAAITGGDVLVAGAAKEQLEALVSKLREAGTEVVCDGEGLRVRRRGRLRAVHVQTLPYPGFPTDLQPQIMALATLADGTSIIIETIFENRLQHAGELRRMGAKIRVEGRAAIVDSCFKLTGAPVSATDLRAGAALVLAGMAAEGITLVEHVEHIDRGYLDLENKYNNLGASISRLTKNAG